MRAKSHQPLLWSLILAWLLQPALLGQQLTPADGVSPPANTTGGSHLRIYNLPSEMVGTVAATLRVKHGGDPSVNITLEPETNRLMVLAPEAVHSEIATAVNNINEKVNHQVPVSGGPAPEPADTQRIYQLRYATWKLLEESLAGIGGRLLSTYQTTQGELADYRFGELGKVAHDLRIDRARNSVLLHGSSRNVAAWLQVLAAIDNNYAPQARPVQLATLGNAKPDRLRRAVNLVRLVAFQNDQADVDEATGAIQLPDNTDDADVPATAIGNADTLNADSGLFGDVQIEFVPELGLVIVRGSKRDVQRVLEVIEQIKTQSEQTQPQIELVPLQFVDSLSLSGILTTLYASAFAGRSGDVSITGLGQPNAILLIGRREALAPVLELIQKLDQPLDPASQLKVFKLLHTSAVDLQTIVRDFFVSRAGSATDPREGLGVKVSVVADYRTNSLIVQASPRDLAEVAKLIAEVDVPSTEAENAIEVFPLRNALADDLATVLQNAINGVAPEGAGTATPPSTKLSIAISPEARLSSGILAGVVVTPNPSINALVVRAPVRSMELIAALIQQLDQPPSLEAQIKVFPVENNDATALAQIIQQIFGVPVTAGTATSGLGASFTAAAGANAGGSDALVPLRVSVDVRSNSIIVSGSRNDLEVVEVLLLRLDEEGVQTRQTQVVWLRNSNATDVATAIQELLQTQRQNVELQLVQGSAISIFEQIDREVIVVAEPTTNSLIISATPRYYEQILSVVERLDRRPPLIMVKVLLAEVQLDDTFELGAEFGLQDSLLFDRGTATGGTLNSPAFNLNTPFTNAVTRGSPGNVAGQGYSGFGLGRSNSAFGYGGLVLSAASDSVNILIRALQDANRLQILSDPHIMTLDTVEAFVQVGQLVPRVTSVTGGGSALAVPQIATEDFPVGLILRIQPRTNQDGLILLDVQVERSSVGPVETGIPVGFAATGDVIRSPIINTTRAQTRISAYDGQTVVFAGLIQKTRSSRSRRVPYLADIPLLGNLFKYDSESESRSELLVVLTPRIIDSAADVEMVNSLESARMSWCLADVVNIHGTTDLSPGNGLWGPPCTPVIYPDVAPHAPFVEPIPGYGFDPASGEPIIVDPTMIPPGEFAPQAEFVPPPMFDPSAPVHSAPAVGAVPPIVNRSGEVLTPLPPPVSPAPQQPVAVP